MKQKLHRQVRISQYVLYKHMSFDLKDLFWSFAGAFLGIGIIGWIQSQAFSKLENIFLIGSFGASAVLVFGAIKSPFSQPRNLIGGHVISAIVGVTVFKIIPDPVWISAPLAVALAIVAMQITKTVHPPGGATALIAVTGTSKISSLGYMYVLSPVLTGVLILFIIALVINNISSTRNYPINRWSSKRLAQKHKQK